MAEIVFGPGWQKVFVAAKHWKIAIGNLVPWRSALAGLSNSAKIPWLAPLWMKIACILRGKLFLLVVVTNAWPLSDPSITVIEGTCNG